MARQLVIAAGIGAGFGVLGFAALVFGADLYFRVAGWRETRQASKEQTA